MCTCDKCGKPLDGEFFKTAYGEHRCADCYDDYLMTDKGKVEYLISIVNNDCDVNDYDADFLGWVASCWNRYRDELDMKLSEIHTIEAKARCAGLL